MSGSAVDRWSGQVVEELAAATVSFTPCAEVGVVGTRRPRLPVHCGITCGMKTTRPTTAQRTGWASVASGFGDI